MPAIKPVSDLGEEQGWKTIEEVEAALGASDKPN
jgi:hypothetical protein